MFIRQHVKTMAIKLTLCSAVTVLSSKTAHCAEQLSPDGSNILNRMNWLFNQVRKNSDKPTLAQQKWIEYLIKQAEQVTVEWKELSDSINSRK